MQGNSNGKPRGSPTTACSLFFDNLVNSLTNSNGLRLGFTLITSPIPGNYTAQDVYFFVPTKKMKSANY